MDFALELEVTVSQLLLFSVKVNELHGMNRLRFSPVNLFRRRSCLRSFAFTFLKMYFDHNFPLLGSYLWKKRLKLRLNNRIAVEFALWVAFSMLEREYSSCFSHSGKISAGNRLRVVPEQILYNQFFK